MVMTTSTLTQPWVHRSLHSPIIIDDGTSDDDSALFSPRGTNPSKPPAKKRRASETGLQRLGQQLGPLVDEAVRSLPTSLSSGRNYHADFMKLLSPGKAYDHLIAGHETPGWTLSSEQKRQIRYVLRQKCEAVTAPANGMKSLTLDTRQPSWVARLEDASPDPLTIAPDNRQDDWRRATLSIQSARNSPMVQQARRSAPQHNGTPRPRRQSTLPNEYRVRHETPVPLPTYAKRSSLGGPVTSSDRTPARKVRPFPQNPEQQPIRSFPHNSALASSVRHAEDAPARRLSHRQASPARRTGMQEPVRESQPRARQYIDLVSSGSDSDFTPLGQLMRLPSSSASPAKRPTSKPPQSASQSLSPLKRRRESSNADETRTARLFRPASSQALQQEGLHSSRSDSAIPLPVVSRHRRQISRLESSSDESSCHGTPHVETMGSLPRHLPVPPISNTIHAKKYKTAIHSRYESAESLALIARRRDDGLPVSSVHVKDVRALYVQRKLPKGMQLPRGTKTSFRLPPPKDRKGTWESQEERNELELAVGTLFDQKGTQLIEAYIERSTTRKHVPKLVQGTRRLVAIAQETHEGVQKRERDVNKLLLRREIESAIDHGRDDVAALRRFDFSNRFRKASEDDLTVVSEFYGCAGDLWAGCWTSNTALICGTTTDGDPSSQQYNRSGNLLLCSLRSPKAPKEPFQSRAQAYPDHRIARPVVLQGENSSASMRSALEPWVFPTVTYIDYDAKLGLSFTSSYDHTVKLWRVGSDEQSMQCVATWQHEGKVNFVIAAKDGSGRVATGTDVATDAVRVYEVDLENPQQSTYTSFSCSRTDADNERWSYFPSTMRWGISEQTKHLLLVGFSPRDHTGEDCWIPREKARTGELILWDSIRRQRVAVTGGGTANIFEVAWHPTLRRFYSATAPSADAAIELQNVRTRIHIHEIDETGAYRHLQSLDCPAHDINELTILPNSPSHAYVAASCTNKRTYIWDSAAGDAPIRQLSHGKPITEYRNRAYERAHDEGTRFTAWGASPDRLYTGGTDGKVNVWDVRTGSEAKVRTIFTAKAAVTFGAFSPDKRSLAIGDASGTLYLLSVQGEPCSQTRQEILDFDKELAPPSLDQESRDRLAQLDADVDEEYRDWKDWHQSLIDKEVVIQHPDRAIGWCQGPNYHLQNWFCPEFHVDGDITMPLLAHKQRDQHSEKRRTKNMLEICPRRKRIMSAQPVNTNAHNHQVLDSDIVTEMPADELWMMIDEARFMPERTKYELLSSDQLLRNLAREGTILTMEDGLAESELVEDDMYALE